MGVRTVGRRKLTVTLQNGVAVAILATNKFVSEFEVFFPATNVGATAFIGDSTVDNTWIPRTKSLYFNFVSGTGSLGGTIPEIGINLAKIFISGTNNGDVAIVEFMDYDVT